LRFLFRVTLRRLDLAGIESPLDLLSQPRKKPRKNRKDPPPA
jgi:hypothetical protein